MMRPLVCDTPDFKPGWEHARDVHKNLGVDQVFTMGERLEVKCAYTYGFVTYVDFLVNGKFN